MFTPYRQLSRNTVILAASIGVVLLAFFAWHPLLALHLRALGANEFEIGVAFSIFLFANTVPGIGAGALADRIGRKWVALAPGALLAPLYLVAGVTTDWRVLTVLLVFTHGLGGVQWPPMQAMIAESDPEHRARAFSLIEIFVLSAAVVGPLLGSLVLSYIGVGGLFIVHGLILIPVTIVRARALHETHLPHQRQAVTLADWRAAMSPSVVGIVAATVLFQLTMSLSITGPFVALLAREVWALDDQQIQQLTALGSVAALAGVWLGGKGDQWGSRRLWISTALGLGVTLFGWGLASNALVGIIFVLGANFFTEALFIVSETLLAHHSTRATRSFLFGLASTASAVATASGPAFGAWLATLTRLAAPFIAAGIASIVSIAAVAPVRAAPAAESTAERPLMPAPGE